MQYRGWTIFLCASIFCASGLAQKLSVETTLVVVPVSVTDHSNRFVLGLEKQNFRIYEDGVEQKISQFSGEDVPLSLGILVDTSASIGSKFAKSRQAVAELLKTMNQQDEAFLVEFSDHPILAVPFTRSTAEIQAKIDSATPDGTTALLDAVDLAVETMKQAHNARKALVLVSDGGENSSKYSVDDVKEMIKKADVLVYALGVFDPIDRLGLGPTVSGPQFLASLCDQTGGRVFPANTYAALPNIARRIGIELRNQYILAYSPINHARNGEYRKLEVKVSPPPGLPDVSARWRLGYYATR